MQSRTVLFVAPEFPPCNLTAGHRTRLFVRHLPEFGYYPIVLTVRPDAYETKLDHDLEQLVDQRVEVIRTKALPTRPLRVVGDLGIRSFPFHLAAIRRLVRSRQIDLIYLPIPPNYSCLLGPISRILFRVPYIIDYIDPWVGPLTPLESTSRKARLSHLLARLLEPLAVRRASGITGVAASYFHDVVKRHPQLATLPVAGIPYGGEPLDHAAAITRNERSRILDRPDLRDRIVVAYAGALLPRAHHTLRIVLQACQEWIGSGDPVAKRVTLLFVGTGKRPTDPSSGLVMPIARECGAEDFVVEIAERQPFVDVLQLLHQVHGILILGSSERHYTASKTFQSLMSERPILAVLHAESTACKFLATQNGVDVVTFTDRDPVGTRVTDISSALAKLSRAASSPILRSTEALAPLTARETARQLTCFFDTVIAREHNLSLPK